jgi:hypothetical protein
MGQDDDDMIYDGETSKFMSEAPSIMNPLNEGEENENDEGDEPGSYDASKIQQDKQDKKYQRILKKFCILLPDEVERLLAEDAKKEEQKKNDKKLNAP